MMLAFIYDKDDVIPHQQNYCIYQSLQKRMIG